MKSILAILALLLLTATASHAQSSRIELNVKPIPKWLHALSLGTSLLDTANTAYYRNYYGRNFYEAFPLSRPLVYQPPSHFVPVAVGIFVGINVLADRMNRSPRFHRYARPMLLLQSAGSSWGLAYTYSHQKPLF